MHRNGYWFVDLGEGQLWSPPQGFLTACNHSELPAEVAAQPAHAFTTHNNQPCYWVDLSEYENTLPRIALRSLISQDAIIFQLASTIQ